MTNREIKFRVWDVDTHEFIDLSCGHHNQKLNIFFKDSHFVFQQYTGLKDKNGKEIYDGDILKIWHDSYTNRIRDYHLAVVIWHYNRWTVRTSSENPIKRDNALFFPNNEENIEVVGNILEHPHMVRI